MNFDKVKIKLTYKYFRITTQCNILMSKCANQQCSFVVKWDN